MTGKNLVRIGFHCLVGVFFVGVTFHEEHATAKNEPSPPAVASATPAVPPPVTPALTPILVSAAARSSAPKQAHPAVHEEVGIASWYGSRFQGRRMSNGKRFDMRKMLAAHRTLPLGSKVKVTNLANGRAVEVTIEDRGPYPKGRLIDLSKRAAQTLGMTKQGLARVRIDVMPMVYAYN